MTTDARAATDVAVEFARPMPGLSPYTSFTLHRIDGAEGLFALRSTETDMRLFLLDPLVGDHGYAPAIPTSTRTDIGADDDEALRLFVVANPSSEGVHINLRAPVVVHRETGRAVQVILEDEDYPIRALLGA